MFKEIKGIKGLNISRVSDELLERIGKG